MVVSKITWVGAIQGPRGPAGTGNNIFEYDTFEDFPAEGETETLYLDKETNYLYRWDTDEYVAVSMEETAEHIASTSNPHSTSLINLIDTTISSPDDSDVLTFDDATSKWIPQPGIGAHLSDTDNPHSTTLANLTDTTISSPSDGDLLQYDATAGKWDNVDPNDIGLLPSGGNTNDYLRKNSDTLFDIKWASLLNYAIVSIEASDPSDLVITTPSTGITFDPADTINNHYVDAHPNIFNPAHEYTNSLHIRSDGRIETLKSGLHIRLSAYCNLAHSINNASVAVTISIELPGVYPITYSPGYLVTNLDLKDQPGQISGSTIFPCPYGLLGYSGTIYGLSFASDQVGMITIYSSNLTLEVIN